MHYDHAGNNDLFPNATFHLQDREMAFCTGRCMCHRDLRRSFEADDVTRDGRAPVPATGCSFHDGTGEIAPGITVHHVGGHTNGLQVMRVKTQRGWVVLASDASHFYANFEQMRAYATVYNVGDMLEASRPSSGWRPRRGTCSRATTRWCCTAIRRRSRNSKASRCGSTSSRRT